MRTRPSASRMAWQQPELDAGQGDRHAVAGDLVPVEVDDQVAVDERRARGRVRGRRSRAAEDRLDPEDELGRAERLGQVVVGAVLQARDPVERGASRRQDEDRGGGGLVVAPDGPDDRPPVELREHEVEDDEGRPVAFDRVERSRAVRGGHHAEAVALEVGAHEPDDLGVVVDDQDRSLRERCAGRVRHLEHGRGVRVGFSRDEPVTHGRVTTSSFGEARDARAP